MDRWWPRSLLTLPLVTTKIRGADEIEYFAYLHSAVFDHDLEFGNEYEHFYAQDPAGLAGFKATFLDLREPVTGRHINFAPLGTALLWAPGVPARARRGRGRAGAGRIGGRRRLLPALRGGGLLRVVGLRDGGPAPPPSRARAVRRLRGARSGLGHGRRPLGSFFPQEYDESFCKGEKRDHLNPQTAMNKLNEFLAYKTQLQFVITETAVNGAGVCRFPSVHIPWRGDRGCVF